MNIVFGVTGGIAAYKAADLCSQLIKGGHSVKVMMTENAKRFIGPLTFEALSGNSVILDTEHSAQSKISSSVGHVDLVKWADVICFAPLTASTMAKFFAGIGDNAISTFFLAIPHSSPILLCPAMNTEMWKHPTVKRNVDWLSKIENISAHLLA